MKKISTLPLNHFKDVIIIDPDNTYIDGDVKIGKNVTIYPNVYIQEKTVIGDNCIIYPNSFLSNVNIGQNNQIFGAKIFDAVIGDNCTLGPECHLRNGCVIGSNCRIGNYVEMKNTKFGDGSKCAHLTYLGDCIVGKDVNIGCGVVTVNYDGKHKHQTIIGDEAFVGSNCSLIAPVKIGKKCVCAAASVVVEDVLDGAMAIARSRQTNKVDYGYRFFNKENRE